MAGLFILFLSLLSVVQLIERLNRQQNFQQQQQQQRQLVVGVAAHKMTRVFVSRLDVTKLLH